MTDADIIKVLHVGDTFYWSNDQGDSAQSVVVGFATNGRSINGSLLQTVLIAPTTVHGNPYTTISPKDIVWATLSSGERRWFR